MENSKERQRLLSLTDQFPKFFLVVFFSLMTVLIFAQNRGINGHIVNENGEPIIGANVLVKGTTNGTITDLDGNFLLKGVTNNATLSISYVGYTTQEVALAGKISVKITLKEDTKSLDEVVVVGYGVQKKSDVTGAMASIGAKQITAMPLTAGNITNALQGRTAGVDVTSNERPGEVGSVRIRGERSLSATNTPLYVVDGIPLQGLGIENLNPQDVESMDVLKDASATAIYGSRGANGVVLITTKRGKSGKFSLNYAGTISFEKMHDRTEMMNAGEWIDYSRRAKAKQGTYGTVAGGTPDNPTYADDAYVYGGDTYSFANFAKGWNSSQTVWNGDDVPTTDWTSYGLQTALTHEHTISASGGTEKMQAYASLGYINQEGTQPGQRYQRYTGKVSVDITPKDWFKMGGTITGSYHDQDYGYNFRKSATGASNIYFALQSMLPWTVPYDDNGDYIRLPGADVNIINPIKETNLCKNQRESTRLFASFYGELNIGKVWKPLDGLRYRIQFGPDLYYYRNGIFDDAESINGDGNNVAQYNTHNKRSWTLDNLLYYDKTFAKKHTIGITLLQTSSAYHYENSNMKAVGTATSEELWNNLSSVDELSSFDTGLTETQMMSFMARANYSFKDRYLLTLSGRWDGASQLAEGNKWNFFPSMALGWRMEQESFIKELPWINQLKLRLGIGTTGNSSVDAYATKGSITQNYYEFGSDAQLGYISSDPSAADPISMANEGLSWEKTTQYNLGVDFSFLHNRIGGSVDVYYSRTKDLLMKQAIPSVSGYTKTWANVGETENKGLDLQLNTVNIETKNFQWSSTITFSIDKNKIKKLASGVSQDLSNSWIVGEPIGIYYDYVYDGIWKTSEAEEAAKYGRKPGEIKVKDLDDEGTINANYDRKIVGYTRPDWTGGLMNTFTYKGWELSFFLYSRWGFTLNTGAETLAGRFAQRKVDYWIEGVNEDAKYYQPGVNGESGDTYKNSMNYQDGSFIKLRNISLGYTFDQKLVKKWGMSNLKVYAQCLNPGLIYSACDWIDPDLGGSTFNRSFVFGLNIGF